MSVRLTSGGDYNITNLYFDADLTFNMHAIEIKMWLYYTFTKSLFDADHTFLYVDFLDDGELFDGGST